MVLEHAVLHDLIRFHRDNPDATWHSFYPQTERVLTWFIATEPLHAAHALAGQAEDQGISRDVSVLSMEMSIDRDRLGKQAADDFIARALTPLLKSSD